MYCQVYIFENNLKKTNNIQQGHKGLAILATTLRPMQMADNGLVGWIP
jgi:hypothetical protein